MLFIQRPVQALRDRQPQNHQLFENRTRARGRALYAAPFARPYQASQHKWNSAYTQREERGAMFG